MDETLLRFPVGLPSNEVLTSKHLKKKYIPLLESLTIEQLYEHVVSVLFFFGFF